MKLFFYILVENNKPFGFISTNNKTVNLLADDSWLGVPTENYSKHKISLNE